MKRTVHPARTRGVQRLLLGVLLALVPAALLAAPAVALPHHSPQVDTHARGTRGFTLATSGHGTTVKFGESIVVAEGQSEGTVVSIGGNVTVQGTVETAVSVGGDVTVEGTVEKRVVSVGGDIRLLDGAVVGSRNSEQDTAIVLIGGALTRAPDATVTGEQTNVKGDWMGGLARSVAWNPIAAPYRLGGVVPWFVQTIVLTIIAVIVAAVAPRQVRAVSRQLRRRPGASLGWGALATFVVLPVSVVVLAITIIGLLVVIPGVALGLPLLALFVGSSVAALVGTLILARSDQRENLILAAVLGVVILSVLRLAPFVGAVAAFFAWLVGLGALVLAVAEWQRGRREIRRAAHAAAGFAPPGAFPPQPPQTPQSPQGPQAQWQPSGSEPRGPLSAPSQPGQPPWQHAPVGDQAPADPQQAQYAQQPAPQWPREQPAGQPPPMTPAEGEQSHQTAAPENGAASTMPALSPEPDRTTAPAGDLVSHEPSPAEPEASTQSAPPQAPAAEEQTPQANGPDTTPPA